MEKSGFHFVVFLLFWITKVARVFPTQRKSKVGVHREVLGTLSKPRRRLQRGRGKTKDLISRTIAQHVRFKTLYIS